MGWDAEAQHKPDIFFPETWSSMMMVQLGCAQSAINVLRRGLYVWLGSDGHTLVLHTLALTVQSLQSLDISYVLRLLTRIYVKHCGDRIVIPSRHHCKSRAKSAALWSRMHFHISSYVRCAIRWCVFRMWVSSCLGCCGSGSVAGLGWCSTGHYAMRVMHAV